MSHFGDSNYLKNEISDSIERFAEDNKKMQTNDLISEIMEAVKVGIECAIYDRNETVE